MAVRSRVNEKDRLVRLIGWSVWLAAAGAGTLRWDPQDHSGRYYGEARHQKIQLMSNGGIVNEIPFFLFIYFIHIVLVR